MGAPRARVALRRMCEVRLAPRIPRRPASSRDIWSFLSSLGERGLFGGRL